MTKLDMVSMTMEQHAAHQANAHPSWGRWLPGNPDQSEQVLYINPWNRFRITYEHHSEPGFGFQRLEEAGEQGVDISDRDAREFAKNFMEIVGDHMSIYSMNIFLEEITKARDEWEKERQVALGSISG